MSTHSIKLKQMLFLLPFSRVFSLIPVPSLLPTRTQTEHIQLWYVCTNIRAWHKIFDDGFACSFLRMKWSFFLCNWYDVLRTLISCSPLNISYQNRNTIIRRLTTSRSCQQAPHSQAGRPQWNCVRSLFYMLSAYVPPNLWALVDFFMIIIITIIIIHSHI